MRQKKTKQMLYYWMDLYSQVGNGASNQHHHIWPERSDIQPAQCRSLLGDMFILETNSGECIYRLAGTKLCALHGRELKRETFGKAFTASDQRAAENWAARLAQDDYLALICSTGTTDTGRALNLETLLMPLTHNGRVGQRILGITVPCETPAWLGTTPIISQAIRSVRVLHPWQDQNSARRSMERQNEALKFPTLQLGENTPPLSSPEDVFLTSNEIMGGYKPMKKVRHLTIIDGGKK